MPESDCLENARMLLMRDLRVNHNPTILNLFWYVRNPPCRQR